MFLGLRSVIYPVSDMDEAKAWYERLVGKPPYFDEPDYVGFEVGGYELGLLPTADETVTYWGVADIGSAITSLTDAGATLVSDVHDVGEGILMATAVDPAGNTIGIIYNPHFAVSG